MPSYNEAPASFNVKAISPAGYDIVLTLRDDQPAELMKRALLALSWLKSNGFDGKARPVFASSPAVLAPSPSAPQLTNGAPVPNGPDGTNSTNGETLGAALISTLVIGQSRSGKLQLQFSTDDDRTFRMTPPLPAMVDMLPDGWTAEHLTVGKAYTVKFRIHWREAGQYKNIFQIDQL